MRTGGKVFGGTFNFLQENSHKLPSAALSLIRGQNIDVQMGGVLLHAASLK